MMTVEQVNEKFKDVEVMFNSYYTFTFTFIGKSEDGYEIVCSYEGDSDAIYSFNVTTNPEQFSECGRWSNVVIKDKEGTEVFLESFGW